MKSVNIQMKNTGTILVLAGLLIALPALFARTAQAQHDRAQHSPYSGRETSAIKALSEEELAGLMNGEGMGMALPAELNGYPGPRHVLQLTEELGLTESQQSDTQAIYERMHEQAVAIGKHIIDLERQLDRAFSDETIRPASLDALTTEIATSMGRLRAVHLGAHLEMAAVLSKAQRTKYDVLRGYSGD